jgi:hypothetical protein
MQEELKTPGWISLRVKPEEYNIIYKNYKATTCSKLSKYVRKLLLNKPVIIQYQDEASREILSALNQISRELSAIGNNFNQTVHKLHTLDHIPEIKVWAAITETTRQNLLKKVEEIRQSLNQIRQSCAHK